MQQIQKAVKMPPAAAPLTSHSTSAPPQLTHNTLNAQQWSYHKTNVRHGGRGDKRLHRSVFAVRLCGHSPLVWCNPRVSPLGATICPASDAAPDFLVWCNGHPSYNETAAQSEECGQNGWDSVCVCVVARLAGETRQTSRGKWKASSKLTPLSQPTRAFFLVVEQGAIRRFHIQ